MTSPRRAACILAALRIGYAAGLAGAPRRLTRGWLGAAGAQPATQVAIRGLAVRDGALHVGALVAALDDRPVRPWLAAAVVGDCADILATLVASDDVPASAPAATALAGVATRF